MHRNTQLNPSSLRRYVIFERPLRRLPGVQVASDRGVAIEKEPKNPH